MPWLQIAGSAAIDTVDDRTCPPPFTDQRGIKRLQDGNGGVGPASDTRPLQRAIALPPPTQARLPVRSPWVRRAGLQSNAWPEMMQSEVYKATACSAAVWATTRFTVVWGND
ncbi:MAG TPA: hypothetical protein VKB96_00415 [Gammaproteobacteria bacterium]|nr:hypothetical protein [Gammaproteobacteria bacterium]